MSPGGRLLAERARGKWRSLAAAGAATGVLTAADLAKPWPLAIVVDHLVGNRTAPFTLDGGDVRLLVLVGLLILGIALAESVARYVSDLWLQRAGEQIAHELRTDAYDHLQRLSLAFHDRSAKGDLLTRVTGDAREVGQLFSTSLGEMVQAGLTAFGITVVLLVIDPVLGLLALATTPLLAALSWIYRRRVRSHARLQRAQEGEIASVAGEALSAMTVVKAFGTEAMESERVRESSERRMGAGVELVRMQARFDGTVGLLRAAGTALVTVAGVLRVASGALSPGDLIVFVSYTRKANGPLRSIAREAAKVAAALARADRVAELLSSEEVLEERPGAHAGGRAAGALALEDVSFAYPGGRLALDGVSLAIPAGRRVALMGPSGAGKSTLAALVARLHDPTGGRIVLDGRDLRDCALPWLRRQVGIVLQDTVLFSGTVHDNIAYGTSATREQVEAVARAAAADGFVRALPEGYETELGPQGIGLSGGQRQRIGIARTLLRDPPVLILDEPTSGLDRESEDRVLEGLAALMHGRTCILITHSPRLAETADEIVRLTAGRAGDRPRRPGGGGGVPLRRLLDPDAVRPALARTLEPGAALGPVAVTRVTYRPGEAASVHYAVTVDGARHDVVVTSVAGKDLAARARSPRFAALAERVGKRVPARAAVAHDEDLDALIAWLPFDPRLPALAEPPGGLARRLRARGADVDWDEPPRLTGYKPGTRAVLHADGHVLKAYGRPHAFAAALSGLRAAERLGAVRTAPFAGAVPDLRLTAQRRLAGVPPRSAEAAAEEAGALLASLHDADTDRLDPSGPRRELAAAARKARVVADVVPELRGRVERLVAGLAATLPELEPAALRAAHGDFHADQLLVSDEGIAVIDFDGLCAAAPALDVATYAADAARGRATDADAVHAVLEPLLAGYGGRPAALDWHLLAVTVARTAHPFHHQVPDWPVRVEAMVATAEALA